MYLLKNEVQDAGFDFGGMVLTNYRLFAPKSGAKTYFFILSFRDWFWSCQKHIPLEKISCITVNKHNPWWLLVLAGICGLSILFAILFDKLQESLVSLYPNIKNLVLIGLLCVVLYFILGLKRSIKIQCDGSDSIVLRGWFWHSQKEVDIAIATILEARDAKVFSMANNIAINRNVRGNANGNQQSSSYTMSCPHCGATISKDAKFCKYCGKFME